jgi:acyl-CoA thioester hydrolase
VNDHEAHEASRDGSVSIRVRYCECDPMNVAHHGAYPAWFEMGRTELLRGQGLTYRQLEADGVFLAVVKLEIRYRRPARYDDELVVITRLLRAGAVKIEHEYELWRGEELLATAATTLACLDAEGRATHLPEVLGRAVEASVTPRGRR